MLERNYSFGGISNSSLGGLYALSSFVNIEERELFFLDEIISYALPVEERKKFKRTIFAYDFMMSSSEKINYNNKEKNDCKEKLNIDIEKILSFENEFEDKSSFVSYVGDLIKNNAEFKRVRESFFTKWETESDKKDFCLFQGKKPSKEEAFVDSIVMRREEYYYIILKADILSLASKYYKDEEDIKKEVESRIIFPICEMLQSELNKLF